jgi:hypothetical protein
MPLKAAPGLELEVDINVVAWEGWAVLCWGSRLAQSQDGDMLGFFVSLCGVATAEGCEKLSALMRILVELHGKDGRFCLGSQIGKRPRWRYTLLLLFLFDIAATEGFELEANNSKSPSS